jgi:hypothetical protein
MTFCYSPWTNVDISSQGAIAPCCKFQISRHNQKFNIQKHTLTEYMGSAFLAEIKQDFMQGNWPQGCERCQNEEQNNIESKRQLDYQRWQYQYALYQLTSNQFITASIAFGNTCNLKCITCNPGSSSRWQQEYREIYNIDINNVRFYRDDFVEKFIEQAPNIVHLDIPGGEPFLSGVSEQQELLKHYVESGQAKNITLHYTTNATVFPEQIWWDLWQHFKEIKISFSVDDIGDRFEQQRVGAKWVSVCENIIKYNARRSKKFVTEVYPTINIQNVYWLPELLDWISTQDFDHTAFNILHKPDSHNILSLSPQAKLDVIEKLKQHPQHEIYNSIILMLDVAKNIDKSQLIRYNISHG